MKWSQNHIFTLREAPADAEITSHKLLMRGGYIKKVAPGIFSYLNLALRSIRKIEKIIREELDKRGCTEIFMPMVQPQELWEETNRLNIDVLAKFKNRNDQLFCLGPTHEEVVTDIIRKDVKSYRDLPRNLYQIQSKFRDEIRPRFGLMRAREFIMKDAYSFDRDSESAKKSYQVLYEAYKAIFDRLGLTYRIVEADAGNIGGNMTHEFQVLADAGEDKIMYCDKCDYAANIEIAACGAGEIAIEKQNEKQLEKFSTPNLRTIDDLAKSLKVERGSLVKTLFYAGKDNKPVAILLRGSDEANPIKVKNVLGLDSDALFLTDLEVKTLTGAMPGSCGPVGLKIPIYVDYGLEGYLNFIVGANEDDYHFKNVNFERDFKSEGFFDLRLASEGDLCQTCKSGHYKSARGIEVGHVFYLGTKYSKAMGATYLDPQGKATLIEMGCYGIGVTRTMQSSVEQNHDKDGIIWPVPIAPFHIHICLLDVQDPKALEVVDQYTQKFEEAGYDVLVDDRDERPGVKFKDADLLGFPVRITVGKRGLDQNEIEVTIRKTKKTEKFSVQDTASQVLKILKELSPQNG